MAMSAFGFDAGLPPGQAFGKMDCFDTEYPDILTYYARRIQRTQMFSPTRDGQGTMLIAGQAIPKLAKAALDTSTGAVSNPVYDLDTFIAYSVLPTPYGLIPKKPWKRQGWRTVKTASKTGDLGVDEADAATLPAGVVPTYFEVYARPKELALTTNYTNRLRVIAAIADAVPIDKNRQTVEKDFYRSLSNDLTDDVTNIAADDVETIQRHTANFAMLTNHFDAGDEDLYADRAGINPTVDRSAEAWADANAIYAAADRNLTEDLIDALRKAQEFYWDRYPEGKAYLTGYDTWDDWSRLGNSKQRFTSVEGAISVGEGVKTSPGVKGGFKFSAWDDIPIVRYDNIDKVGAAAKAPIHLVDLDYMTLAMGKPFGFQESENPFEVGLQTKGLWNGICENVAWLWKGHGSLHDLA
jgi:hypothetical protein